MHISVSTNAYLKGKSYQHKYENNGLELETLSSVVILGVFSFLQESIFVIIK